MTPFEPLSSTHAQRASHFVIPEVKSSTQDLLDLGLDHLDPLAPIDVPTDTTSGLVFPCMDTLAMQTLYKGEEVKVPQPESNYI
jgi:hypothetical protein